MIGLIDVDLLHATTNFPILMRHENYIKNPLAPIIVDCGRFFNNMTFARRGDLMTFLGVYGCNGTKRILNDRPDVRKVLEGLKRDCVKFIRQ